MCANTKMQGMVRFEDGGSGSSSFYSVGWVLNVGPVTRKP